MTGCVLLHLAGSPPAALPPYQLVPTRTRSAQNSVFFEGFENPHRSLIEACVETHTKSGHSPNLALPFLPYYYCPLKMYGLWLKTDRLAIPSRTAPPSIACL
ncbi:hypothetical protein F4824DRAFT_493741 [Ustulina deusta]|nr:hypothetical protein F4824DRAFT_493741 [Ustulina deusta]